MTEERRLTLPLILLGLVGTASVFITVLGWRDQGAAPLFPILFAAVGALIARRTRNRIGWLFLTAGAALVAVMGSEAYLYRSSIAPNPFPEASLIAVLNTAITPVIAAFAVAILLLFPTGHPPTPRWRPWLWSLVASLLLIEFAIVTRPGPTGANHAARLMNPMGIPALATLGDVVEAIAGWAMAAVAAASLSALVMRYRRSSGDEREQIRWLAYVGIVAGFFFVVSALAALWQSLPSATVVGAVGWGGFVLSLVIGLPAGMTLAILKYNLYGIDVVINKTIVYAALAAFITAVYVALVVGVGTLLGSRGRPSVALSILATAVVAVAFQPVRERVERFANRLVYGTRATPYEALSTLSDRMATAFATEDLLPRMARILAEATGASRADVWLLGEDGLRVDASWPQHAEPHPPVDVSGDGPPLPPDRDRMIEVRHRGELLGALSITKKRGEVVTPVEDKLMADLAGQAGLVLRNVGLTEQLKSRLEEIRASRQRLVAARDEERRRLERNIHDGAQQQLVALAVKLRLARQTLDRDEAAARDLLRQVRSDATDALENLRELARGIYPPLLADKGLPTALEAQARKSPLQVLVDSHGIERYPPEVEAAVYFCALEGLQNVAKYADASSATVHLSVSNGDLRFEISDDGVGFDPAATRHGTGLQGMADRLDALGGSLAVRSGPGTGTSVEGRVPIGGARDLI